MHARSVVLVSLLAAADLAHAQQDLERINGSLHASAGTRWGDISTVNGSITVDAATTTDHLETVNGAVTVGARAEVGGVEAVNGAVRVGSGAHVRGGIENVNGGILLERGAQVATGIENVAGGIGLIDADVGGSIETVAGDVTIGAGSHVRGDLSVRKPKGMSARWQQQRPPRIIIGRGAVVDGALVFERPVTLYIHDSARTGRISGTKGLIVQPVKFSGDQPDIATK